MVGQLYCPADERRNLVRSKALNAIDYLEVLASKRTLLVHCFRAVGGLDLDNVVVEGGVRVGGVRAEWAYPADELPVGLLAAVEQERVDDLDHPEKTLVVRTDSSGDFSTYVLRLVASRARADRPAPGFDPVLNEVAFSFKVDCPSDFDCAPAERCEEAEVAAPHIDYLARDYASFRRLILDRLAVTIPAWQERSPADLLIALTELLAYAGDYLSYYQDAVATEAYLGTARLRRSVRRHARLLDYRMHDGASARAWVCVVAQPGIVDAQLPAGTPVLTAEAERDAAPVLGLEEVAEAVSRGALVFETAHAVKLRTSRNRIPLYDWGDPSCCLPRGATGATLLGSAAQLVLRPGDVLVFEEVRHPVSGLEEEADPTRRHAVRLREDWVPAEAQDPATGKPILEIEWHPEDALPSALSVGDSATIAYGNVVLADHGWRIPPEALGRPRLRRRFRPLLKERALTHRVPYDDDRARGRAAAWTARVDPREALPDIEVEGGGEHWSPERELLGSDRFATSFVAEMEEDGRAFLRFGDGTQGREPDAGVLYRASYRLGTGSRGNVGAKTLTRIVASGDLVESVTNPLPAQGGVDPEPLDQVRLFAPQAFRSQRRAVTAADYAMFAQQHPKVQRAGATRRWTGSWYTIFVTVDRLGGREIDPEFERELRDFLDPFRLAGYDLEIDGPQFVPLDLELTVCLAPGYLRSSVKEALQEVLGPSVLPRGRKGFFHPDNFTFAQPVYLSRIVAAAMGVTGVEWVEVTRFHRWRDPQADGRAVGKVELGRLEIARLDNDPNRPENGRLELKLKGGL